LLTLFCWVIPSSLLSIEMLQSGENAKAERRESKRTLKGENKCYICESEDNHQKEKGIK